MKLSIIVPAYNEVGTLREVIDRVRRVSLGIEREIIVVDDGSTDGTTSLLDELAGQDLIAVRHPFNQGKGAAIRTALDYARGDVTLIQDADLEYDPEDYPRLLEAYREEAPAAVYGSRFLGSCRGMRPMNRIANRMLSRTVSLLYGQRITDEATCYKLIRTEVLRSLPLQSEGFDFCPEVTALLLRTGRRIVEVPIHNRARTVAEGKKITWVDGFRAIWALVRLRFIRLEPPETASGAHMCPAYERYKESGGTSVCK